MEAGGSGCQGQPGLLREFEGSLGYTRGKPRPREAKICICPCGCHNIPPVAQSRRGVLFPWVLHIAGALRSSGARNHGYIRATRPMWTGLGNAPEARGRKWITLNNWTWSCIWQAEAGEWQVLGQAGHLSDALSQKDTQKAW